jgi:hypothetical protein
VSTPTVLLLCLRGDVLSFLVHSTARTTIYISEFRGLDLVSRITFAVFRPFKSQFKLRMAEEALDSFADDNDDISLTRSVPGELYGADLMLDRVSRVVCGDGATSLRSDERQDGRIKEKDFMEKMSIFRESMMRDCAFACKHNIPGLLMTGYSFLHFLW